jgi:hypothetical protein
MYRMVTCMVDEKARSTSWDEVLERAFRKRARELDPLREHGLKAKRGRSSS